MDVKVERSVVLDTSVDEAWRALTDQDELSAWMGGDVELDPRPGGVGVFRLGPDGDHSALVIEVDPGRRLAMQWWPLEDGTGDGGRTPGPSSVELVLTPLGSGDDHLAERTLLTVVERSSLPAATVTDQTRRGPQACALLTGWRSRSSCGGW